PNYFTRLLGSHYNGGSLHPQYTTPPPQVQGSSQFQERQAMQQQYPPQSMPTPPADTRPDDMVESDGMSNDESRKKWTIEDDKLLASSYLIISTDSVKGYYLADGIYPEWATMVKSFAYPEDPKRKKFKKMQEAARKNVERAFGVLQARWAIVRGAARFWHRQKLKDIMYACVILHNMIVENEGNAIST
ncbi:hypothetical protein LINPERHAP2_LOCUS4486, partial [Linum perenne]